MQVLFSVVVGVLCFSHVAGAESLTLSHAIDETLTQSLQIQKARSAQSEARWKKRGSYVGFLPTVSASANYLTDKKYMLVDVNLGGGPASIAQVIPTTLFTVKASLPLFDGFASTNRLEANSSLEESARLEADWTEFQVQRQTVLQFYRSLASQVLSEVSAQNLRTLQDHLKDIQAFKRAGVSTNYDVLRVEVQVSEAQSEVLNTVDNVEIGKFKLGEILGKAKEDRVLEGQLPVLNEGLLQNLKELENLTERKDIIALQKKSEATHLMYQAQRSHWSPRLGLFAEWNRYNNINDRFQDSAAFRESYLVGANLTWNLFDGFESSSRSGEAQERDLQTQKSLKMSELKAKQDLELWKRKFKYFCAVFQSRNSDVARSEEAVRLAKEGRRAGVRTSSELLDAELDLFRARAGRINAQVGAVEALISLELASGQKLYNFN